LIPPGTPIENSFQESSYQDGSFQNLYSSAQVQRIYDTYGKDRSEGAARLIQLAWRQHSLRKTFFSIRNSHTRRLTVDSESKTIEVNNGFNSYSDSTWKQPLSPQVSKNEVRRIPEELPEESIARETDSPDFEPKEYDLASLGQFTASSSDNLFIVSETNNTQSSVASNSKSVRTGEVENSTLENNTVGNNTVETPPPLPAPRKYSKNEKSDSKSVKSTGSKSTNSVKVLNSEEKLEISDFFQENQQPVQKQRRRANKLASDSFKIPTIPEKLQNTNSFNSTNTTTSSTNSTPNERSSKKNG
jgi:hypothetical protein